MTIPAPVTDSSPRRPSNVAELKPTNFLDDELPSGKSSFDFSLDTKRYYLQIEPAGGLDHEDPVAKWWILYSFSKGELKRGSFRGNTYRVLFIDLIRYFSSSGWPNTHLVKCAMQKLNLCNETIPIPPIQ